MIVGFSSSLLVLFTCSYGVDLGLAVLSAASFPGMPQCAIVV